MQVDTSGMNFDITVHQETEIKMISHLQNNLSAKGVKKLQDEGSHWWTSLVPIHYRNFHVLHLWKLKYLHYTLYNYMFTVPLPLFWTSWYRHAQVNNLQNCPPMSTECYNLVFPFHSSQCPFPFPHSSGYLGRFTMTFVGNIKS